MRTSSILAAFGLSLAASGCISGAQTPLPTASASLASVSAPPRLIVAIAVDQFSADLFAQYRGHFTGGLARLQQGAVFPTGFQSHAATETCPGHSTLLTGVRPRRSGIIANYWFDPSLTRVDKSVYCVEDEADSTSTSKSPVVSSVHLKVPTLGDRMKVAWPASRNVAVSAKDRAVIMMGGHTIDEGYWWKSGAFVTVAGRKLAPEAVAENAAVAALLKSGAPALDTPTWCTPLERAIKVGGASIGTDHFALKPGNETQFRTSPRVDAATAELALALTDSMALGKGTAPDLLSISFSATDYIGHAVGTGGVEMCIQMAELDRTIGRLLEHLDGLGIDYAVTLSADHGGLDVQERLITQALPKATRVSPDLESKNLAEAVTKKTGISTPDPLIYADGPFGDLYLSRTLTTIEKDRAVAALIEILRAHPQVAAAFPAAELAKAPQPTDSPQDWSLLDRARASFDEKRSGDVILLLDRAVVPISVPGPGYTTTHGSAWDYDRRVPMIFWRPGVPGFEQPAPVETVDIAPTIAAILGLAVPNGEFDGRCLDIDGGAANTCETEH